MLLRVFMRYRMDYEMFGYDINTALRIGGHKLVKERELELLQNTAKHDKTFDKLQHQLYSKTKVDYNCTIYKSKLSQLKGSQC